MALDARGLSLAGAWFSTHFTEPGRFEESCLRFLDHLSFVHATGARCINVCECGYAIQQSGKAVLGNEKPRFDERQWDLLIQGLHIIGRLAHDWGMTLAYHYHAGTGVFFEDEIDFLMRHTSPDLVALLLDTGHAAFAGVDPRLLIARFGSRIRHVHLKDVRESVWKRVEAEGLSFMEGVRAGVFTVPGDGMLDFPAIVSDLKDANYRGWCIVEAEQDPKLAPALIYAQKAREHLSALF